MNVDRNDIEIKARGLPEPILKKTKQNGLLVSETLEIKKRRENLEEFKA